MEQDQIITSKKNERIRQAKRLQQKKYRDQEDKFCLEGVRLVEEALLTPYVDAIYFTKQLISSPRGIELLARANKKGVTCLECTEDVLFELTDTVQAQGVVAVVNKPSWTEFCPGVILIADEIQDPGNMGTLLRTAVGAGVKALFVIEGSVDLYNPKVLRSSMGAIFHLPHQVVERQKVLDFIKEQQITLAIADLIDAKNFWEVNYPKNIAVVIGNEARGVHQDFRVAAKLRVQIPLTGQIESLNASVAAGVLLYEILRQHHCNKSGSML